MHFLAYGSKPHFFHKKKKKKKKPYRQERNLLPLATGVALVPLVLFENPSNTLASVELGARCKRAESITPILKPINWWVGEKIAVNIYIYIERERDIKKVYLQTHSVVLRGAWQALGRPKARVALIWRPRLGSSLSLINIHRHFLLFCRTCLRPVQQSRVGAFAWPPT
jgi:hypothetical protein